MGEWVRQIVLEVADGERAPRGAEQALMAEVIALRTIVLNALFDLASGESIETERMRQLIAKADAEKLDKAIQRLKQTTTTTTNKNRR